MSDTSQNYVGLANSITIAFNESLDKYYNKNEIYNKEEIDNKLEGIVGGIPTPTPPTDLSNYYNKIQTDSKIDEKISTIPPTDLSNYYTKIETDTQINTKINEIPPIDLTNYYNKIQTDSKIDEKISTIPPTDLTNYYNKIETDNKLNVETFKEPPAPRVWFKNVYTSVSSAVRYNQTVPESTVGKWFGWYYNQDSVDVRFNIDFYWSPDGTWENKVFSIRGNKRGDGKWECNRYIAPSPNEPMLYLPVPSQIVGMNSTPHIKINLLDKYNTVDNIQPSFIELSKRVLTEENDTKNITSLNTTTALLGDLNVNLGGITVKDNITNSTQNSNYITEKDVDVKIDNKISTIPPTDLTNYYTKTETDNKITEKINAIPPSTTTSLPNVNINGDISGISFQYFQDGTLEVEGVWNRVNAGDTYADSEGDTILWEIEATITFTNEQLKGIRINIFSQAHNKIICYCEYDGTQWVSNGLRYNKAFFYYIVESYENSHLERIDIYSDLSASIEKITNSSIPIAIESVAKRVQSSEIEIHNIKNNIKTNYFTKNDTYNKADIDDKIGDVNARIAHYHPGPTPPGLKPIVNTTIIHNAPIIEPLNNYILGKLVFMSGKVFKLENHKYIEKTTPTDCIPSVKTTGEYKEFLGIIVGIHDLGYESLLEPTIDFATHGDFKFTVDDSSVYSIGDTILYTGQILSDSIVLNVKLNSMRIGIVSAIVSKTEITVFKS